MGSRRGLCTLGLILSSSQYGISLVRKQSLIVSAKTMDSCTIRCPRFLLDGFLLFTNPGSSIRSEYYGDICSRLVMFYSGKFVSRDEIFSSLMIRICSVFIPATAFDKEGSM